MSFILLQVHFHSQSEKLGKNPSRTGDEILADLLNDFKLPITVLNKQSQVHQDIFTSKQLILFFADFQNTKKVEEMRLNS